jgi:hypothetical protein
MSRPVLLPGGTLDGGLLGEQATSQGGSAKPVLPPISLPPAGPCPDHPTLVILIFDNSGSVTGGNDPVGNRFEEATVAINHLAKRCRCGQEQVALRTFDLGTASDIGPMTLNRKGPKELYEALRVPGAPAYGSSCLGPSLADAERLAAAHRDHEVVLVVFSDFELLDGDTGAVVTRLRHFAEQADHQVHAVVLRSSPPAQLHDSAVVITHVPVDSPRGAVARAVLGALVAARRPEESQS